MSGEIQLLVESIDRLGNANNRTIFSVIVNLIYTLVTIGLLVVGWKTIKLTQKIASSSQSLSMDLKKQDLEQRVLREDVLTTVIPVYSSDCFSKTKMGQSSSGDKGFLKVFKHHDRWVYLIIEAVHYKNGDTGDIIASNERELEYSNNTDFKGGFMTKHGCIEYAMTHHNLTSPYIKFDNSNSVFFNSKNFVI